MQVDSFAALRCHQATPCEHVQAVRSYVRRTDAQLELGFRLEGDIPRLCLSPPRTQIDPELWRHTCFEVFVAIDGQPAYHEFNFSPYGEWCAYAFRAYRDPVALPIRFCSPVIYVRKTEHQLDVDVRLTLNELSASHSHSSLCLGLSAIIEQRDGTLSYWAVRHPAAKPDFHHADAFALRLQPPTQN
jgi:hypothetical protein